MRIAFTGLRTIGGGSGGVEKAVEEVSVRLAARGHDVTVFCRTRYNPQGLTSYRGVRMVNLPAIYTKHLEAISHTFLSVLHALAGYDLVHVHATGPSMLAFVPRLAGRKVVVTVHGLDWKREKWRGVAKPLLRMGVWTAVHFPHRTIAVSRHLQRELSDRYRREIVYIPNGIPEAVRRPCDRIRRFGVSGNDYVLFLGRLVPEKGCHVLLEAFKSLAANPKLLVVGGASHSDDYTARLHQVAKDDPRIVFTGPLYGEEKDEAYSNALCLVLPSTLEGMSIVLLEAMSYRCPVLCSAIPENLEVLQPPGGTPPDPAAYASTFAPGQVDDLKTKLADVLAHPDQAAGRAAAALRDLVPMYSWDRVADQVEAVYRRLLQE
ncbi:MAG: glycosyltransferase family 4 protein [Verrucomicrobiota bacterium]